MLPNHVYSYTTTKHIGTSRNGGRHVGVTSTRRSKERRVAVAASRDGSTCMCAGVFHTKRRGLLVVLKLCVLVRYMLIYIWVWSTCLQAETLRKS